MKETTKKTWIYENIHNAKDVVKILDIVSHESGNPDKRIVIFRSIHPLRKPVTALNSYVLDFEFLGGSTKTYTSVGHFEETFKVFVHDEQAEARLKEGFYDN